MDWSSVMNTTVKRLDLGEPKVHRLPAWEGYGDPKKMDVISRIGKSRGRDPRIATLVVGILKKDGVPPRDYRGQAAAILKYVQHQLYYVNEPGERLQDPLYTLKVGYGDCDDLAILMIAMLESIRLPHKLVISGNTKNGKLVRYHQGDKRIPRGVTWSHIYVQAGNNPFHPTQWFYMEPTLRGVPLGWDVVGAGGKLPELQSYGATPMYGSFGLGPDFMRSVSTPTRLPSVSSGPSMVIPQLPGLSVSFTQSRKFRPGFHLKGKWAKRYRRGGHYVSGSGGHVRVPHGNMTGVLVVSPDGRILLLRRSATVSWHPNFFDLPGGKTNPKLPSRQQAAQLLLMETSLNIKPHRLIHLASAHHPASGQAVLWVLHLTPAEAKLPVVFNSPEHSGAMWVVPQLVDNQNVVPYVNYSIQLYLKATGKGGQFSSVTPAPRHYRRFRTPALPYRRFRRLAQARKVRTLLSGAEADDLAMELPEHQGLADQAKEFLMDEPFLSVPNWAWVAGALILLRR